jgi:perosamine synthetase
MIEQIIKKIKLCLPKKYKQVNVHEPIFEKKDITYLKNCLDSSYVSTEGKYIDKFTENLKKITNSRNILLTNSGTSALF